MKPEALENLSSTTPSGKTIKLEDYKIDLIEFLQKFIHRNPFRKEMVGRCECKCIKPEDFSLF